METSTWSRWTAALLLLAGCTEDPSPTNPADSPYEVVIIPADFLPADSITGNTYFPISVGRMMIYEGRDGSDAIRVEERVTDSERTILGVQCRVVNAREFENDDLIEDTFDWYAQDRDGNVWYFGEDSREIKNGQVAGTSGSWEAGVDGAMPGVLMMARPFIGAWYRQEFYEGEAEDVAQVLTLGDTLSVPYGFFANCLRTMEYSPLEPGTVENKIYAPGVGLLRAIAVKGGSDAEDLSAVISP